MRYIKGTVTFGLTYSMEKKKLEDLILPQGENRVPPVVAYSDSDWAEHTTRRSTALDYYTAIDRSGLHTMSDPTAPEPPRGWKGSGRYGQPIPGEIPGGPKPIVWRGMVLNSKVRTLAKH